MARIRSIKPEFWTSDQVVECSVPARLLFIGIWNFCDDHGRHPLSAKRLKALIYPSDEISPDAIWSMLVELCDHNLIEAYEVGGKEYFHVTGWAHQKIDKRQPAKYPGPENGPSFPIRRMIDERSTNDRGTVSTDRNGREGIRGDLSNQGVESLQDRESKNGPELKIVGGSK